MIRALLLTAEVIWPNVALLRAVDGCPHWNQLNALNASARSSKFWVLEIRKFLVKARSRFLLPGPRMLFRTLLPSVPAAGWANAFGSRNLMPPLTGLID